MLAALVACDRPSIAERVRVAATTADYPAARAACRSLPDELRGECLVDAFDRLGGLDRADCDALAAGVWRDECVFLYAERLAAAGRVDEAVAACGETRFARACGYHLVRDAAEGVSGRPLLEAAAALAPFGAMPMAPDAPRLFWRAWFRARLDHAPIDPTPCADAACDEGAREAIYFSLKSLAYRDGAAFCANPPLTDATLWAETDRTRDWVEAWTRDECQRRGTPRNRVPPP